MLHEQRATGPVVVVDAGGSFLPAGGGRGPERAQNQLKAELIATQLAAGGIDGMAVAAEDWRMGRDELLQLVNEHHLPVLAANLECEGKRPFPSFKVVEVGGRRVGLVGVTTGKLEGCTVADARVAAIAARSELGEVDLAILLAPIQRREVTEWGAAEGGVPYDVVLGASVGEPSRPPVAMGSAWAFGVGTKGKHLGLLTVTWRGAEPGFVLEGEADALREELRSLEGRLASAEKRRDRAPDDRGKQRAEASVRKHRSERDAAVARLEALENADRTLRSGIRAGSAALSTAVADHLETEAAVKAALARITELEGVAVPVAGGPRLVASGPYAGTDACRGCHAAQTAQWAHTPHARAYRSLVDDGHHADRACIGCHVTGWEQAGGPGTPAAVAELRDVQCEACHGPSRAHAEDPETGAAPVRAPEIATCTACHDGERDQGRFDAATYLPLVVHQPPAASVPEAATSGSR